MPARALNFMDDTKMENNFTKLAAVNVQKYVEKKNGLSYLSWAYAVDQILRHDPLAYWTYGEPVKWGDTVMVFCTVTAFGKPMTAQLPVMDHRNKAIPNPDAFQVNVTMQRCLAKAIALHGLGLYLYAGEDFPISDEETVKTQGKAVSEPSSKPAEPAKPIEPQQLAEIAAMSLAADLHVKIESALKKLNLDNIEKLNSEQAAKLIAWLKK